jgi:hypothetical protein
MEDKQLTFTGVVEKHSGAWIATCIDTGIVAGSPISAQHAVARMSILLDRIIQFAIQHDRLADIYHAAPRDVMDKYINNESRLLGSNKTIYPSANKKQNLIVEQKSYATASC